MICFTEYNSQTPKYEIDLNFTKLAQDPETVIYDLIKNFKLEDVTLNNALNYLNKLPDNVSMITGF